MWTEAAVSIAVNAYALPRRHQRLAVIVGSVANVLVLLLAFRVLTGLAFWVGSSVAIALIWFGAALQLRWNDKVKRVRKVSVRVAARKADMHLCRAVPSRYRISQLQW